MMDEEEIRAEEEAERLAAARAEEARRAATPLPLPPGFTGAVAPIGSVVGGQGGRGVGGILGGRSVADLSPEEKTALGAALEASYRAGQPNLPHAPGRPGGGADSLEGSLFAEEFDAMQDEGIDLPTATEVMKNIFKGKKVVSEADIASTLTDYAGFRKVQRGRAARGARGVAGQPGGPTDDVARDEGPPIDRTKEVFDSALGRIRASVGDPVELRALKRTLVNTFQGGDPEGIIDIGVPTVVMRMPGPADQPGVSGRTKSLTIEALELRPLDIIYIAETPGGTGVEVRGGQHAVVRDPVQPYEVVDGNNVPRYISNSEITSAWALSQSRAAVLDLLVKQISSQGEALTTQALSGALALVAPELAHIRALETLQETDRLATEQIILREDLERERAAAGEQAEAGRQRVSEAGALERTMIGEFGAESRSIRGERGATLRTAAQIRSTEGLSAREIAARGEEAALSRDMQIRIAELQEGSANRREANRLALDRARLQIETGFSENDFAAAAAAAKEKRDLERQAGELSRVSTIIEMVTALARFPQAQSLLMGSPSFAALLSSYGITLGAQATKSLGQLPSPQEFSSMTTAQQQQVVSQLAAQSGVAPDLIIEQIMRAAPGGGRRLGR